MITIRPVRILQVQNGSCHMKRYTFTHLHGAPLATCYHMCACMFNSIHTGAVSTCEMGEGGSEGVGSIFMSSNPVLLISTVQLCDSALSPQHVNGGTGSTKPECFYHQNCHDRQIEVRWDEVWEEKKGWGREMTVQEMLRTSRWIKTTVMRRKK